MTTGRPLTPEEQQRLARRERTLKNRRGRRNPAVMPDRLARTSAFVPRKVNLITDSNFTRVYEVPGYSVVEVRGRELGSQHRDAIYALFRLKREKVSMPNPDYRPGTFIPPMRTYYETRTSWRELIRVMGRTEHVNNLLSLVHVFQEIQQVSVLIHEGRSLDELDKIKKTRSIGALPDSRGSAAPLITEVSWEGAQLDSSVTVRYGPSVLQMIEKAHLVSINADVQFRLKGDHAKTFWPFIDSQPAFAWIDEERLAQLAGRDLWSDKETSATRAMLMTMTGMVEARISANLMSLGALDFGLIVDGAVIITENALRHLAEKQAELGRKLDLEERLATVRASAEEMIKPSLFGQAIIILVYVPLLTFTGVEGKMFEPMALTVIIALVSAFVLSLTFVPAMIAIVITGKVTEKDNLIIRAFKAAYRPALGAAVRAPLVFISAALLLLAGAGVLFTRLGAEFIPTLDEKSIAMNALRIPSTSLSQSQAMQLKIEQAVSKFPQVAYVFSKTGTAEVASDPMPQNSSDTFVILKPQEEWPDPELSKAELQEQIEKAVGGLAGNVLEFSQPIQLRFNELLAGTRGDLAVKVFGEEFEPMTRVANQIAAILRGTPGAEDVKVEQTAGLPFLEIKIDKIGAARLGLSTSAIQEVIGAAIGGKEAGMVFEGDRRFPIVVRLTDKVREDREALENLPVSLPPGPNGRAASVLLKQVASFTVSEGPNQISRENGKRRVVVTANVRGRDIGSLVAEAQAKVGSEVQLPSGYSVSWGGQFENLASARQRLMIVVPVCFFLIFLLLYSALGSPRDALLVFSAVPLALTGGIAALWLRGMPFSVPAAVGFIALSGVAVLNGLVMLTFIKQLIAEGRPKAEAIYEGAMTRLRPVAMTALVASLGFVPMALATETGAEIQRPLATVVIGGLISATLLTLLVLPALYARFGGVQTPTAPRREEDAGAVRRPLRQAAE